jgi:hypothetical protein
MAQREGMRMGRGGEGRRTNLDLLIIALLAINLKLDEETKRNVMCRCTRREGLFQRKDG